MKKENLTDIQLHSAGATVRHKSPFEELESFSSEKEMTQKFREDWIIPYYFELNNFSDEWIEKMIALKPSITEDVILQCLGNFDWRPRSTGSYFASIKQAVHLQDIIGTHLLKSEVCYAGAEYARTLAIFNTEKSTDYFNRYLDYYLTKPNLYFDQGSVIIGLKYLDELNGTNEVEKHLDKWDSFLKAQDEQQIKQLENLITMVPEKKDELQEQIENFESSSREIDTEYFKSNIDSFRRIIES